MNAPRPAQHRRPNARQSAVLPSFFNRYRTEILTALHDALPRSPAPYAAMMRYHMGWLDERFQPAPTDASQGKAFRPTLCLFCCESLGGDWHDALPAAAALELVHNFSLVHDDIQDGDRERRHRSTVWSLWGMPTALWVGNGMRAAADTSGWAEAAPHISQARIARAAVLLTEACLEMVEGQYLDMSFESRPETSTADYLDMVGRKTGALVRCAMEMGAVLAVDDPAALSAFRTCGYALGVAFQVRDDILGIWGNEAMTGKSAGNDILRRKKGYPIVYAFEHASPADRRALTELYASDMDGAKLASVMEMLAGVGAREHAQALAERLADDAIAALASAPMETRGRYELTELVEFILTRDF